MNAYTLYVYLRRNQRLPLFPCGTLPSLLSTGWS